MTPDYWQDVEAIFSEASDTAPTSAAVGIGSTIGAFRLIERLGEGGMGTVYLAERRDGHFDQRVAIKVIGSWLREQEALNRFRVERQILASLQHPNIVTPAGFLNDGGRRRPRAIDCTW